MRLRKYCPEDLPQMAELFYNSVHRVCTGEYTCEQLNAWATGEIDAEQWNRSFLDHVTLIAEEKDEVIGFGDIDNSGYLDRLYVHYRRQREGIGTMLCDRLERAVAAEQIITHASLTAKPFFERRGYRVLQRQQVERSGILLTNFVMKKEMIEREEF